MNYASDRIAKGDPLTLRLIRDIHAVLLAQGRGEDKQPGEFRRSQNWIGGSRPGNAAFVPPPPTEVMGCLDAWEKFLHDIPERTPTLIKAALLHVQFETIHPFLDGNGRIGRLLIPLLLVYEKALEQPLLYLSLYFKTHRATYYDLLQTVRQNGDWEGWVAFFLEGVAETAEQATRTAQAIFRQTAEDRQRIEGTGRSAGTALRLHHWMQRKPVFTIMEASRSLQVTPQTVINSLKRLEPLHLVQEVSGRQRGQVFVYGSLMKLLGE
ncbi:MAG: Fic family protein [Armatimonadetes bacterium]|nr:Fic family protein [Armatimonadota bacterium]